MPNANVWALAHPAPLKEAEREIGGVVRQALLRATAVEHGNDWRVRWSVATLHEYIAGERRVSEGSSAPLPGPGIYQVELELEHLVTRAVRSTHSQIALGPPQSRNREPRSNRH
jgi:hypothetical protein